jgi:2-keto-4-pentenoate hydratase/2-oxohepta-3-ene-1,7-dioic acid hydratase in catechol pathway
MKLVHFKVGEQLHLGVKTERGLFDVNKLAANYSSDAPLSIEQVIARGKKGLLQLTALINNAGEPISEEILTYAPAVMHPEKIICVGLNYDSHSKECNQELPTSPVLFSKFNNALAAHNQVITLPKSAEKFDYEAELVIIIGKEAVNVSKEDALSYIFGYTVGNDLSARDLQMRTGQWLLGKTCDHFAPIGPYIVTSDEIDPNNLDIECLVNGIVRQSANTSDLIFDCATIVSYISKHFTLKPGDIIFTGTPSGVILGYPEAEQKWLKAGDKVTVSIQHIGSLTNTLA